MTYGILKSQADLLVRIDNEDRSNGERNTLLVDVGKILLVEHVLGIGEKRKSGY
jgi:hypothetical protein